jgi:acyl-coenzyme A thioesterase PaaI-like protein
MLGRAATWNSTHPHVIAASAHFLRSPEPGPITIETETLRAGRSATQVRARMVQGDLVPVLPTGQAVAIMEQVEVRLEPATRGFTKGQPSGRGELRGWLALPADEGFDPNSLLFAVDAFPPATFDVEFVGSVPTLELTAYVRALPAPGALQITQRAQLIEAGRVDEVCYVWDSAGRLVAQGTQLAGIRLG